MSLHRKTSKVARMSTLARSILTPPSTTVLVCTSMRSGCAGVIAMRRLLTAPQCVQVMKCTDASTWMHATTTPTPTSAMGLVLGPPTGSAIVTVWCLTPTTTVCVMRTKCPDAQTLLRATTTQGLLMKMALVNSALAQNQPSPCPWIHFPQRRTVLRPTACM